MNKVKETIQNSTTNRLLTSIVFFLAYSGYYVVLMLVSNFGSTSLTRSFTIPIRIVSVVVRRPNLSKEQKPILEYNPYAVVSAIFKIFHFCFPGNIIKTRNPGQKQFERKAIPASKNKIRILNFSLNLFAQMVLVNQWQEEDIAK